MHEESLRQLRDLVTGSREELQAAVGHYDQLLRQLSELERALESGALSKEVLVAAERVFWGFPRLAALRAAAPTDDGLDETRALLVEIRNRIVMLEKEQQD